MHAWNFKIWDEIKIKNNYYPAFSFLYDVLLFKTSKEQNKKINMYHATLIFDLSK